MGESTTAEPKPDAPPATEPPPIELKAVDFLWKTYDFQQSSIRFADTKAGAALVLATATAGSAFQSSASTFDRLHPWAQYASHAFLALTLLAFTAAIVSAFAAIRPRGIASDGTNGLIHFVHIAAHEQDAYARTVLEAEGRQLADELAKDLWTVSDICRRKFLWVDRAVVAAALCAGSSIAFHAVAGIGAL